MSDRPIIPPGPYVNDLLAQPRAVADTVSSLRNLAPLPNVAQSCTRVVLTGMGSSLYALHPLQIRCVKAGRTAFMVETSELIHYMPELLHEETLVVVVSQSGRSAETVALLDLIGKRAKRPFVVGVTNTPDSPLAAGADAVVMLKAGPEFSVSCKTYLATLAALEWVGGALCGDDLNTIVGELSEAAGAVEAYLAKRHDHVQYLCDFLQGLRHLFLTGRGRSLAAVGTGALILKESTRFHAEGMSSPAFRHGPLEMVNPGLRALVFAGDRATSSLNELLVRDVIAAGGRAAIVGEGAAQPVFRLPSDLPARVYLILEMLPVQMMSLALAVIAGREPGVFQHASKVTVTQ